VILFFIEIFSNIFEFLETILELAIFWGALFPLKFTEIKNCCIIRDAVVRVQINGSDEVLNLSKIAVDKIEEEYNKRQDSSSNKMRILFQTLSFVFAVNAAILTYILKELKQNIDIFFVLSLIFITVSLFMILIYYKVSSINKLTFPEKLDEYSIAEYLSDMLYCLDFNNKRLDFFVTVYKAALRYFIVSIIFLVFAIAKQFHTHINIFNECKPSIFVMIG
jgi:uncharacterized membrane protein